MSAIVLLVEGISDQIAVQTFAARLGRTDAEVVSTEGAQGMRRHAERFAGRRIAALCDAGEADVVRHALADVFVCVEDLEDELIRAIGLPEAEELLGEHGDLAAFRTIQRQPAWRGREPGLQLRRFLGAGARRKVRYARLLSEAMPLDRMPAPIAGLLAS